MKYWLLGLACAAWSIALLLARHLAPSLVSYGLYATYAFAGVVPLVTAAGYAPRDRLRWAWAMFGLGYLIGFASKLVVGDSAHAFDFSPARAWTWSGMVVLLNLGSVMALILFARVWSGTGLAPPWRRQATLICLVVALAIDGRTLYVNARDMAALTPAAFGAFASILGDIINITLVGPIFVTAIALRGGVLMRPWMFLFAGALCWIADDTITMMPDWLRYDFDMVARPLAVLLGGAAALAQLWVKREVAADLSDEER